VGAGEDCDGANLDGGSCSTLGFSGGALACTGGCLYDSSGCYVCGNGVIDPGEACDGANLAGGTCALEGFDGGTLSCSPTCAFDITACTDCGNGVREAGEPCEGADLGGSSCLTVGAFQGGTLACSAACTFDTTGCTVCGDGAVAGVEQCDGTNLSGNDCTSIGQGFVGGTLGCTAACAFNTSACTAPPTCPNGMIDPAEQCDGSLLGAGTCASLGYTAGALACTAGCAYDTSGCYTCGNGVLEAVEVCDGTNLAGENCMSLGMGFDGGTLACAAGCLAFDTAACSDCGNAVVESPEVCDGSNLGGGTCISQGFGAGALLCTPACTYNSAGCYTCGDGILQTAELCDGVNLGGATCASLGYATGTLSCGAGCTTYNTTSCTYCGNALIDAGEQCDGANLNSQSCTTIGGGYTGGTLACTAACAFNTAMCISPPTCPNGVIDAGEQCDGANLNGGTCSTATGGSLPMGTLACGSGCLYDTAGCASCGNGTAEGAEPCDGTDLNGGTCSTVTSGTLPMGSLSCTVSCGYSTVGCSNCGNGTAEGSELCDAADLNGATCSSAFPGTYSGGSLSCNATCNGYVTGGCFGPPTVPVQRKPLNNTYVGTIFTALSRRPTFTWLASTVMGGTAITYDLQYSTSSTFTTGVTNQTGLSALTFTPTSDLAVSMTAPVGSRYYWHVRACAGGACSAYSSTWLVNVGRNDSDFNGDGYADVAVGAPFYGATDSGQAYVYYGGSSGPDTTADFTITGVSGSRLGTAVALGDVNGDGYADLVVGAPYYDSGFTDVGRVTIYYGGSDATVDGTITGGSGTMSLGSALAVGDVNGDWNADVVAGAPGYDTGGTDIGQTLVYFGAAGLGAFDTTADGTLAGAAAGEQFGFSVAAGGDANGDGYGDIVVGAPFNDTGATDRGQAYVFFGGSPFNATSDGTLAGGSGTGDQFGFAVTFVWDLTNDGFSDVAVGAPYSDATSADGGRVRIYNGGTGTAFNTGADFTVTPGEAGDHMGWAVSYCNRNGDAYWDLIVGVPLGGGFDLGQVELYYGAATFDVTSDESLIASGGVERGRAVGAGDVNGDNNGDVLAGDPLNSSSAGAVVVFYGGTIVGLAGTAGDQFGASVN
jgi:hypothetical protein